MSKISSPVHGPAQEYESSDDEEMKESLKDLIDGQHVLVYMGNIPDGRPTWFDEEKFEAGKQFVRKYYGGIFFAHLVSLTLLLYSPQVLKPLIFTGKSETPRKSYRRYISTTVHVMSWYNGDIWKTDSKARQSLQTVRHYHSETATRFNSLELRSSVDKADITNCGRLLHKGRPIVEIIRKDFNAIPDCPFLHLLDNSYRNLSSDNPIPYFNQLDMSGTQFAFMGLVLIHPEKFGISRATDKELEGYVHMWRCLGWILGIDDRFNFCRADSLPEARRWTRYFQSKFILPSLKISLTNEYEHMGRAVVEGARSYVNASYETFYLFIAWVLGLSMPHLEKSASPADHYGFKCLTFMFGVVGNLPYGNYVLNGIHSLTMKLIVDPPRFWPRRFRPPAVTYLKDLWMGN